MIRCRFYISDEKTDYDPRPIIWPIKHPYWITGSTEELNTSYSIVVAYADNEEQILELWPEATKLDSTEVTDYVFTSRFPKPTWLDENQKAYPGTLE